MTAASVTKACRVTFCLPVPGFFSKSGQLGWFKARHGPFGIWSSTLLQLPGMLLSNPSSYQEDEKRGIFLLVSHGSIVVAFSWQVLSKEILFPQRHRKIDPGRGQEGVSNISFSLLELFRH